MGCETEESNMSLFSPLGSSTMGKHFGELARVRGVIQYRLSPFEQRAFAGAISKGLPNILYRVRSNIFRVLPRELNCSLCLKILVIGTLSPVVVLQSYQLVSGSEQYKNTCILSELVQKLLSVGRSEF
jgi:hypothetical protein